MSGAGQTASFAERLASSKWMKRVTRKRMLVSQLPVSSSQIPAIWIRFYWKPSIETYKTGHHLTTGDKCQISRLPCGFFSSQKTGFWLFLKARGLFSENLHPKRFLWLFFGFFRSWSVFIVINSKSLPISEKKFAPAALQLNFYPFRLSIPLHTWMQAWSTLTLYYR